MTEKAIILDDKAMGRAIARISYEIIERNKGAENLVIIGVLTRGVELARRIGAKIYEVEGKEVPVGSLDITPHRDDVKTSRQYEDESAIPFDITGKKLVIVDDVIYTGRSARAAIDALMKRGRPQSIQLAVLIDRGHRELPIRADFVGKNVPTSSDEQIKVCVTERDGADRCAIWSMEENR